MRLINSGLMKSAAARLENRSEDVCIGLFVNLELQSHALIDFNCPLVPGKAQ